MPTLLFRVKSSMDSVKNHMVLTGPLIDSRTRWILNFAMQSSKIRFSPLFYVKYKKMDFNIHYEYCGNSLHLRFLYFSTLSFSVWSVGRLGTSCTHRTPFLKDLSSSSVVELSVLFGSPLDGRAFRDTMWRIFVAGRQVEQSNCCVQWALDSFHPHEKP